MRKNSVPDVFVALAKWFHEDFHAVHASIPRAVAMFVAQLDLPSKLALHVYVTKLLTSDLRDEELQDLLVKYGAEFYFTNDSARRLFENVQETIEASREWQRRNDEDRFS